MKHTIQIKEPCHENWNNMSVSEKGRFCDSCSKQVIDFTKKSNEEIISHLNNAGTGVCGRVSANQLDCVPNHIPINTPWYLSKFKAIAASLVAIIAFTFLSEKKAIAQSKPLIVGRMAFYPTVKGKMAIAEQTTSVKGQITESYSENPLPFCKIIIESGNKTIGSATTDSNGEYQVDIKPGNLVNSRITVTVSSPGYETKILNDLPMGKKEITLSLDMNNVIRMGDISVAEDVITKEPVQIKETETKSTESTALKPIQHYFLGMMVAFDPPINNEEEEPVEEAVDVVEEFPIGDIDIREFPDPPTSDEQIQKGGVIKIVETIPEKNPPKEFETVYINKEGEEIENPNIMVDNPEMIVVEDEEEEEMVEIVEIEEGLKPEPANFNPELVEKPNLISNLYPNPATNYFTLSLNSGEEHKVQLYDAAGRMVKDVQVRGVKSNVDIHNLKPGYYLVKVITDTQVETKNIVIY